MKNKFLGVLFLIGFVFIVSLAASQSYNLQPDPSSIATPPGGNVTNPSVFYTDTNGHLVSLNVGVNGIQPSACGTSPSISGTDVKGIVTTGSTATTQCTLTFSVPYTTTPTCVAMQQATTTTVPTIIFGQSSSSSASAVVFNHTSSTSVVFNYICYE